MAIKRSRNHLINKASAISKYDGKVADILKDIVRSTPIFTDDGIPSTVGHNHDDRYYLKSYIDSNYYDAAYITTHYSLLGHTHNAFEILDFSEAVDDRVSALINNGTGLSWAYNDLLGTYTPTVTLAPFNTDNLTQGSTNLYTTVAEKSNWNSAYSWGNHALAGYISASYLDDYTRGNYRVISDYGSNSTWYLRSDGQFIWGTGHDWTASFRLNLPTGGYATNGAWAYFGQQDSNSSLGSWRGIRIKKYASGVVDGDISAGAFYVGDSRKDLEWSEAYSWGDHALAGYALGSSLSSYLLTSGGVLSGVLSINTEGAFNPTTPGTNVYGLHFSGQVTSNYATGITWNGQNVGAQAGIYVQGGGSYGTRMYIATTDAYVSGSKTAISIDETGKTVFHRSRAYYLTNILLDAGNYNSYAPTLNGGGAYGSWSINITGTSSQAYHLVNGGGRPASSGSQYFDINSTDGWAFLRLSKGSATVWDIAEFNGGNLEFRPAGGGFNSVYMTLTGNIVTTNGNGDSSQWFQAYSWGNHALAGYLTALPSHNHDDRYYTETESDSKYIINNSNLYHWAIQSAVLSTSYTSATLELYSSYGAGYTAPRLSFHWGGLVASQIGIQGSGRIAILNNPGTSYEALVAQEIYSEEWLRNNTAMRGIYNEANSNYIYSESTTYWTIASANGSNAGGIVLRSGYTGTIKGYVYYDTAGFGLLHGGGGWSIRGNVNSTGGTLYGDWVTSDTHYASNFGDKNFGAYNVNLGNNGFEGRGLVAGFSGGSYAGIGYNVRHTTTGGQWIAPLSDTSNYILFSQGFYFYGEGTGTAGRVLSYTQLGSLTNAGHLTILNNISAGGVIYASGGNSSQWNQAFSWGNHALAGYLTTLPSHNHDDRYYTESESDDRYFAYTGWVTSPGYDLNTIFGLGRSGFTYSNNAPFTGPFANFAASGYSLQFGGNYTAGNDFYIRTRNGDIATFNTWKRFWTDYDFTSTNISNWNTAYAWGNHATFGYITSYSETDTLQSVTNRGNLTTNPITVSNRFYTRRAQSNNDYTSAALWTESYDNTTTGIAFHISGNVGKFLEMRTDGILYWENAKVWFAGNLDAPNKNGTTNYQTAASLQFLSNTYGLIWPSGAGTEIKPTTRTYGSFGIYGSKGGSIGLPYEIGNIPTWMFDASSNGGLYFQATGLWALFYEYSSQNWMINNASGSNLIIHSGNHHLYTYTRSELDGIHDGYAQFTGNSNSSWTSGSVSNVFWVLDTSPTSNFQLGSSSDEIECMSGGKYEVKIYLGVVGTTTFFAGINISVTVNASIVANTYIPLANDSSTDTVGSCSTSFVANIGTGDKIIVTPNVIYEDGSSSDYLFIDSHCRVVITKLNN